MSECKVMPLAQADYDLLFDVLNMERRNDAAFWPHIGLLSRTRRLERLGLLKKAGYCHDIDGEWEGERLCWQLTEEGRKVAEAGLLGKAP